MSLDRNSVESDEEIVTIINRGDETGFKILIERYVSSLYNFVARIANRNDAPDIVQETFIKVWKNLHHFDGTKASFKTWIFTIARNTATDYLRKKKSLLFSDMETSTSQEGKNSENSFLENIPDDKLLPDEQLQKIEDKEFLNKLLEKLSAPSREILVLHYQEEMTFDEIGKILWKPLNTVKSTHRRAILELRKYLE